MQDKDIKDEVLEEDINKEEVKEEAHEHEHKHEGHTCCGKHGHKHEEEIEKLKAEEATREWLCLTFNFPYRQQ